MNLKYYGIILLQKTLNLKSDCHLPKKNVLFVSMKAL